MKKKIILVAGARPNFMKIAPIMHHMKRSDIIKPFIVHTGQHYDVQLSQTFFNELQIPEPDITLDVGSDTQARQVAKIMEGFEPVCYNENPYAVLVVGDVNSTMACSIVAAKMGIKVIHVEAGIRSGDRSMPEEINRMVTDAITDIFFPPSSDAVENLIKEGHNPEDIHMVGNIMIDTLLAASENIRNSDILNKLGLEPQKYATLTLHRPSNVDNKQQFLNVLNALQHIQSRIPVVFPMHPRTAKMIAENSLSGVINSMKNIIITEPLGYFDFGRLVSDSYFVLTDSGGVQEETTVYGIPCITLRENTERPVTVWEGTNELAGNDTQKIIELSEKIFAKQWKKGKIPALWDGKTAERIVDILQNNY